MRVFKPGDLVRHYRITINHNSPYGKIPTIYRVERRIEESWTSLYILKKGKTITTDVFRADELQLLKRAKNAIRKRNRNHNE